MSKAIDLLERIFFQLIIKHSFFKTKFESSKLCYHVQFETNDKCNFETVT